jgi:hypothetical protein
MYDECHCCSEQEEMPRWRVRGDAFDDLRVAAKREDRTREQARANVPPGICRVLPPISSIRRLKTRLLDGKAA